MDFIKGNEQVRIDPSGIDISGTGHIFMNSNGITGDISFNDKVTITNVLDVNGDLNMVGDLSMNGDLNMVGDLSMNGDINISGNNNFVITNNGNVGIGINNPLVKLQIGASASNPTSIISDIENGVSIIHPIPTSSTNINDPQTTLYLGRNGTASQSNPAGAFFKICRYEDNLTSSKTRLDIDLRSNYSPVEKIMTLLDNGAVGIGTTNPENALHVTADDTIKIGDDTIWGNVIIKRNSRNST